jgi:medium-chain acyl-[acyl-carrier-protein] hydrolase
MWLASFAHVPSPEGELVCLPHAGGGVSVFHGWQRHTTRLRIWAVRLPGRELRLLEPAVDLLDDLVDALVPALASIGRRRYALYGHSMGAIVAFELTRRLREAGSPLPAALFVAGSNAPHLLNLERTHDLPRDKLLSWLDANGVRPEAPRQRELLDLMLPTLRADLAVIENYTYQWQPPLPVPIHVLRGRDDKWVSSAGSSGWAEQTSSGWSVTDFHGGHFFVRHHERRIVSLIESELVGWTGQ